MSDLSAALASAEAQMLAAHPGEHPSWEWLRSASEDTDPGRRPEVDTVPDDLRLVPRS